MTASRIGVVVRAFLDQHVNFDDLDRGHAHSVHVDIGGL